MIRPPVHRVYGNISGSRTSQFRPPRGLDRLLESIPPLRFTFAKLVPGISPPLLNRFLRFRRRCNLLMKTFPTMYNITHNCHILEDVENGFRSKKHSSSGIPDL